MVNGGNQIALTFVEQVDRQVTNATKWSQLTQKVKNLVGEVEKQTGVEVTMINTGKQWSSMVTKDDDLPAIDEQLIERLRSYL